MNDNLQKFADHMRGIATLSDDELDKISVDFTMEMLQIAEDAKPIQITGENPDIIDKIVFALACGEAAIADQQLQMAIMIIGDRPLGNFAATILSVMLGYLISSGRILVLPRPFRASDVETTTQVD